jgi:Group 4 capsule polysaccharide lipoprotein gfcB, YjbF
MGTILAMITVRTLVLTLSLALSACGTAKESPAAKLASGVVGLLRPQQSTVGLRPEQLLTRDVIDKVTVPYRMVGVEQRNAYASMELAGQNGPYFSWVTSDGAGLSFRGDVLTSTRGLGVDLLSADVAQVEAAVAAGGVGDATREHHYLDGEGHEYVQRFSCTYRPAGNETIEIIERKYNTRVIVETCASADITFENRYWIGRSDGVMWQSRQWVSEAVGSVLVLNLVSVAS